MPGSRGDEDGRRKVMECRQCPRFVGLIVNRQRRTPYYCNKCEVGLHPECFGAYHAERGLFFHHHLEAEKETEQMEMKSKISYVLNLFFKSNISPFLLTF